MIEITQGAYIAYILAYIIVFIIWFIFMNKYFKYKNEAKGLRFELETIIMLQKIKSFIEDIPDFEEEEISKEEVADKKTPKTRSKAKPKTK